MKIRCYLILPVIVFLAFSCSDYLEETPVKDLTTSVVYTNRDGLAAAVVGLYNLERYMFTEHPDGQYSFSLMCGTDISVYRVSGDAGAAHYSTSLSPASSFPEYFWRRYYQIVERANSIIFHAREVDMSSAERKQILGEAMCFRSHAYFHLLRMFDNIYLSTEPTTSMDRNFMPAPMEDVYARITADLDSAIVYLDWNSAEQGRYTQGVARHLKAKVAMWLEDWDEVANQARTIIESGLYSLAPDPEGVFLPDVLDHREGIYLHHFNVLEPGGDRKFHRMPLLFMPRYNEIVGVDWSYDMSGYAWGRLYPNDYLIGLYEEGDKRYEDYIHHCIVYNDPENLPDGVSLGDTVVSGGPADYLRQAHPGSKKYWDLGKPVNGTQSYKDVIIYRLAETYLIYAEALMHLNDPAGAAEQINMVRRRAGASEVDAADVNLDLILDERARELNLESLRWYTLKRTSKLIERVRLYAGDEGDPTTQDARINIRDYHVRKPIPQNEIDLMPGYPQNEGYEALGK